MEKLKSTRIPLEEATGKVLYNMTNDYMFHIVLQRSEEALKGLIAALLHIRKSNIKTVEIKNPLKLGETIDAKTGVLDVLVEMNNNETIDLEMQVEDEGNWEPRSIYYLSRVFTGLKHGEDFGDAKPAYFIGFLDFPLFPEHQELYGVYRLKNIKDGHEYSDKFTMGIVELNNTGLATEEDKKYGIDKWVRMFKADTWEEMKMLAQENREIDEAVKALYGANTDESILRLCRKSDEEIMGDINRRKRLKELESENKKIKQENKKIKQEHEKIKQEHEKIKREHEKVKQEHEKVKQEHEKVIQEQEKVKQEHEKVIQEQEKVKQENKQLKQDNETLKKQLELLQSDVIEIKALLKGNNQ